MLLITKLLLFLEFGESRNVYENTMGYANKAGMLLINQPLMDLARDRNDALRERLLTAVLTAKLTKSP